MRKWKLFPHHRDSFLESVSLSNPVLEECGEAGDAFQNEQNQWRNKKMDEQSKESIVACRFWRSKYLFWDFPGGPQNFWNLERVFPVKREKDKEWGTARAYERRWGKWKTISYATCWVHMPPLQSFGFVSKNLKYDIVHRCFARYSPRATTIN